MIKKLFSSIAMFLIGTLLIANPVTVNVAKNVATNYYQQNVATSITDYSVKDQFETKYSGLTTYYTFIFNAGGFVMVAADDAVIPILGFSTYEPFDKNNIPPSAQGFFNDMSREIIAIVTDKVSNVETLKQWNAILSNEPIVEKSIQSVSPLCSTTWDQGVGYNTFCPSGTPTGCVATGMAQIMKKWNYPATGTGSHSYTHPTYGVLSANFGATTYQWASMSNTSGGTAVATLMYQCGVSINMDYEPAGSGAYNTAVPPALINYFNYQPTAEAKLRSSFPTDVAWLNMVKEELNEGRPLLLSGDNNGAAGSGHEWVCDGYINSGNCHMNWGWSGSANGNYPLTQLNPQGNLFNSNRGACIRITPLSALTPIANFSVSTTIPAASAPVNFTDLSLNNPTSWLWTFDGGTPATSTSQNPTGVTFATNGYHLVSLKVTNANGSDIKTRERYVKVGGAPTLWIKQNSAFTSASRGIDQISIVDANTVWAKAYDGTNPTGYIRDITRTNNGGTTWTPGVISFTNSANYGVANIQAFDYMNAFACMFPVSGYGGQIVKTTDGGATWNVLTTSEFTTSWADFVHFFDASNGIAVGDPTATTGTDFWIYRTTNGGTTWTQVPNASIPNCQTGEAGIVNLFDAVGSTIWFTTNKGRCYKSTDMGVTWNVYNTGMGNTYTMKFKDANVGIAVLDTLPYSMKKTSDGGVTWQTLAPTGYLVKSPDLAFVPGTTSTWVDVAISPSNGSTYSMDDGATFMNIDSGSVQFTSVSFLDANTGWAGSFNASATDDGIYKWNPAALTATGINNANQNADNIVVYPIPAKDIINIQLGKIEDETMNITVYNVVGEKVISKQIRAISNDIIQLDMSDKNAGLYFVTIVNGGKTVTKKITIVK